MQTLKRCNWAENSEIERNYHDTKWAVPLHDERELFRMLLLEGMQAGLSWVTILNKMDAFDAAFDGFDPVLLAKYDEKKVEELLANPGIIRNKLKIRGAIKNAQAYLKLCEEFGSLDKYLWSYVENKPIQNAWKSMEEVPAKTELSEKISRDLKKRGFSFVGPTIIYAYMQAIGMVNDHLAHCHRAVKERKDEA